VGSGVEVGSSVAVTIGVVSIVGLAVSIEAVGVAAGVAICPCAPIGHSAIHSANPIDPTIIQRFNTE
jgi:hypothetical protein